MVPFSVLDLCPVLHGGTVSDALRATLELARHVENLGFRRFWLAEHHNMPGIASAATAVVIAHVAAGTSKIRVGSGGIMLPNHAPLVIAEQFGTLEALFPGRIDLGIGRAPGTDQNTARALRQGRKDAVNTFPQDVLELQAYFQASSPGQSVVAVPGAGARVPLWILGSSLFGAQLAAALGLPYAFASHFAPDHLEEALAIYRREFQPSENLPKPYAMAAIGFFAAETDREAQRLFSSWQQSFLNLRRGEPSLLAPPVDDMAALASPVELAGITAAFREAIVGSPATAQKGVEEFLERTGVDELMLTSAIYDQGARKRSFEIAAGISRGC